jgi:post-segregation antitoxin (ccd killing protein)
MPRTTVDLDAAVLRELKRRSRARGTTMSRLASELLAHALANEAGTGEPPALEWRTAPMRALVDVRDKEALHRALDGR